MFCNSVKAVHSRDMSGCVGRGQGGVGVLANALTGNVL